MRAGTLLYSLLLSLKPRRVLGTEKALNCFVVGKIEWAIEYLKTWLNISLGLLDDTIWTKQIYFGFPKHFLYWKAPIAFTGDQFQKLELALTGSGLPLLLQFDPGTVLNFAPCSMGERSDVMFTIYNQSKLLSVRFHFKKTAHFKMDPQSGHVNEGLMQVRYLFYVFTYFKYFKVC